MTTMHSYYRGLDLEALSRSNKKFSTTPTTYDRPIPYDFYEHHHFEHTGYKRPRPKSFMVQDQGLGHTAQGHARRRIQIACSRCRRRKIKCSGDPGDNSGCSSCRAAGADRSDCTFYRVGERSVHLTTMLTPPQVNSYSVPVQVVDTVTTSGDMTTGLVTSKSCGPETFPSPGNDNFYFAQHRLSLPTMHTRIAPRGEYDTHDFHPAEYANGTSSISRQETALNTYVVDNSFRPWTANSMSVPVTSTNMYFEPHRPMNFTAMPPPACMATPRARLPSMSRQSFSSLSMDALNSSLPAHTVQDRRLPTPTSNSRQQSPFQNNGLPQISQLRPFVDSQPRVHINGIHSRNGMPWSLDTNVHPSNERVGGGENIPSEHNTGVHSSHSSSSPNSLPETTILGYHFPGTTSSPSVSPTSGPPISENFTQSMSTSMAPASVLPLAPYMRPSAAPHTRSLNATDTMMQLSSPSRETPVNFCSFRNDQSGSMGSDNIIEQESNASENPDTNRHHQNFYTFCQAPQQQQQQQHPPAQQVVSNEFPHRRSSYDQQHHATAAHRLSTSSLGGRY